VGQLIKSDIGVEVLFVDCGGWDNHVNEAACKAALESAERFGAGACGVSSRHGRSDGEHCFCDHERIRRTAKENGNRGTDHGRANCMFVMGGDVKGGHVYGKWPGLAEHQLNEGAIWR